MFRKIMMFVCFLTALFCIGCGGGSDHDDVDMSARCVPGQIATCMCASGTLGYQVCADDGRLFGACDCPAVEYDAGTTIEAAADDALPEASNKGCPEGIPADMCPGGWYECTGMSLFDIQPGALLKSDGPAVFYYSLAADRYVFPNEKTYRSWYPEGYSCPVIHDITTYELASIPIGGNICYKPGVRLLKITTDPRVYAVSQACTLRWIQNESLISQIYGPNWKDLVDDVPDAFFGNYTIGQPIAAPGDYNPFNEREAATSVEYGIVHY